MDNLSRQVYIISDLHLGGVYGEPGRAGDRGFRINTHVPELADFVGALVRKPAAGPKIELIINGDAVDFLAEREAAPPYFVPFTRDPDSAARKLEAIAARDRIFFEALGNFLRTGRRLTILLGNHDAELALPAVRRKLESILGVDGHQDYRLIYGGEAYIVGDALIEHGNRYDQWNVIDYDSLRRICSLQSRRQPVPEDYAFDLPAGSGMVAWVMNPIKESYRFVDLLKPETDGVIPLLLALEPGYRKIIAKAAELALRASKHKASGAMPSFGGDIHAETTEDLEIGSDISSMSFETPTAAVADSERALDQVLVKTLGGDAASFRQQIESRSGPDIGSDISTMETLDQRFGLFRLLSARDNGSVEARLPALWKAFRALQNDKYFDRSVEGDPAYIPAARDLCKGGFRYVIFGHTHAAKKVKLDGDSYYLNSGAWVDLMRVPKEIVFGSQQDGLPKLREFVEGIARGDLSQWILYMPTYVRLDLDTNDNLVHADLYDYTGPDQV